MKNINWQQIRRQVVWYTFVKRRGELHIIDWWRIEVNKNLPPRFHLNNRTLSQFLRYYEKHGEIIRVVKALNSSHISFYQARE